MARDSPSLSPVDSPVNRCESSSALRAQAPGGRSGRELGSRGCWPPALSLACPSSLPPGPRLRSALPAVLCTCPTAPRPGAPRAGPGTSCWGLCAGPNSTSPLRRGRRPAAAERPGGGSTVVLPVASLDEPQRSSLRWPGDRGDLFRNKCVACFGGGGPGPLQEPSGLGNPQQLRGVRGQSPCRFFPGYSCSGAQLITPGLSQSQDLGPSSPEPQPHSEGQSRSSPSISEGLPGNDDVRT